MRSKAFLAGLLPLSLAAFASAGCGGLGNQLTDLICECEHCDDWREEKLLATYSSSLEIATIYACDPEWELLAQCEIDEGTCDEDKARWSVTEPGSCNGSMDLMTPCMSNTDCIAPGSTCSTVSMTCVQKVCSDGGSSCTKDSDCSSGEYKCLDELQELLECEDKAADDKSYIGLGADND